MNMLIAARDAGVARVEKYYSDKLMFQRYRTVYDTALNPLPVRILHP